MQQRQPRLGDILDDYCPRERRVTNHVVVAMVGVDVKQTRCSTCDAEHEYKHAKVPRQRRKAETPAALYAQVASGAPKRIAHEPAADVAPPRAAAATATASASVEAPAAAPRPAVVSVAPPEDRVVETHHTDGNAPAPDDPVEAPEEQEDEGPVHRPLIRASLPRSEGQPPPTRPLPEFTIRQPGGRQNRFRPRNQRTAGQPFQGNRQNGKGGAGPSRGGGMPRPGGESRLARRHGPGRKRSK
jgi:hypothetical protein